MRSFRFLSLLLSGLLAVSGFAVTSVATATPAEAAAGDPFPAADPYVFIAQNAPTGLFKSLTGPSGSVTFSAEGPTSAISYNAIAYNTANNYIYAFVNTGDSTTPSNSLIRIGQGGVYTRVGTGTYNATVAATFGADGLYYSVASVNGVLSLQVINVTTGALVRNTAITGDALTANDITFKNGFLWMMGAGFISRINPTTGATVRWTIPFSTDTGDQAGAAWTFGNGNLGFGYNVSGTVYQVAVANPSAATPTFTLVSTNPGPASGSNDGTSSPGQPTDLAVTKTGPAALIPGGTASYTITVKNNGPGNSSGFSVRDAVPAPLTNVASTSAGCTVSGNTVTCLGGRLLAGDSVTYTVTASVPANIANSPVTNTATVTANETDSNSANNTSSTTGKPARVVVVKHAGTPVDVNGDSIVDAGDSIDYTFTVTNTGAIALDTISVSDAKVGAVTCPAGTLAPAASMTCAAAASYTITATDVSAGGVDNSATASGTAAGTTTTVTSSPSTTHTPTTAPAPGLSIVKSASPSSSAAFTVGQLITYTFVVTNTGNVPLSGVSVDDSDFSGTGTLSALSCPTGSDTIAAGAQVSCTATYTLTQADVDAGLVRNAATATGTPPGGTTITTPPSQMQIPVDPAPAIGLVKSADPATANAAGDVITYSFRVTNTGNVTLTDPSIAETAFSGTGTAPAVTCPTGSLVPGQAVTCTASYAITQADVDAGSVTNTATATATPPSGAAPVSDPSSAAVTIAPAPALTIAKTATPDTVGAVGDTVTYSFVATNTGNVTLNDVTVDEGAFSGTGTLGPVVCPAGAASLAPGASVTCTASYTFTQADIDTGKVTNSATATAAPPGGGTPPVSPPSETIVNVDSAPAITVVKSATPTTIGAAGNSVTYSFLVTNTGNVTLTDPTIDETAFSGTGTAPVATCPTGPVAPGASVTCTAAYTATQADMDAGSVTNTATATAVPPTGLTPPVSDPSSATVTADVTASLTVLKSADMTSITTVGQNVKYSFLVTNTGNVTLHDIAVDEGTFTGSGTLPPAVCPQSSLAPGASETCTTSYTVTQADLDRGGTLSNTATGTGTPPGSNTSVPSTPSTVDVPVAQSPALSLVKSASPSSPDSFRAGQDITYSFVVTNTGNVTIDNVSIQESQFTGTGTLPAPNCPPGALAPGTRSVCTAVYTVTQADVDAGKITNKATATGTPPGVGTPPVSPPSEVTVPTPPAPAVTMVKTADLQSISHAGQTITYTFTITNTGNVTVTDPTITEGTFTGHGTLGAPNCPALTSGLAPGQVLVCHATYTVVAADLTGGAVTNTATVTVTPPGGDPITSTPSTATVPDPPEVLAATGAAIAAGLGAIIALLGTGGILLFLRRRRRPTAN